MATKKKATKKVTAKKPAKVPVDIAHTPLIVNGKVVGRRKVRKAVQSTEQFLDPGEDIVTYREVAALLVKNKPKNIKPIDPRFPPPYDHPVFAERWNEFLAILLDREGFHIAHLAQLEVLCNLFVQVAILELFVRENGYTFRVTGGRNGFQLKQFPEVGQLHKSRSEIRSYLKLLGLLPSTRLLRPSGMGADDDGWEDDNDDERYEETEENGWGEE